MAGLVKTRSKRVTYPLDDKVKARLVGRESYASCDSDHYSSDDVSPCLSELVHSFLEEEESSSSSSSESRWPRNDDDDSDRVDSVSDRPGAVECILRSASAAANADPYGKVLHADVAEAVEAFSCLRSVDKWSLQRNVVSFLRGKGHNAAICTTKWSSAGSTTAGHYEFIDVIANSTTWQNQKQSNRYFVDVEFAAEFEIARPSGQYTRLSKTLPRHFVGGAEDVKKIVRVVCDAAKKSLRSRELSVPPWRKNRYMQNKWFGPHKRTVNPTPENPQLTRTSPPQGSGAKCRWVGFDDVVSEVNVAPGRVYIRT